MNHKKLTNPKLFEELYLAGLPDGTIAKQFGCYKSTIAKERGKLGWEPNDRLFAWQRLLRPSQFKKIPPKYRDPKLCLRED